MLLCYAGVHIMETRDETSKIGSLTRESRTFSFKEKDVEKVMAGIDKAMKDFERTHSVKEDGTRKHGVAYGMAASSKNVKTAEGNSIGVRESTQSKRFTSASELHDKLIEAIRKYGAVGEQDTSIQDEMDELDEAEEPDWSDEEIEIEVDVYSQDDGDES